MCIRDSSKDGEDPKKKRDSQQIKSIRTTKQERDEEELENQTSSSADSDENTEDYEKRKREKALEIKKTATQVQNGQARKLLMNLLGGAPMIAQIS